MSLRAHLTSIYEAHQTLTPKLVVDTARDEAHPLHGRFEWDDTLAGERYREGQAAELIRSVKVIYREATDTEPARMTRAWVAPRNEDNPNAYEPVEKVAADPLMRAMTLRQMERDWRDLKRRYAEFEEFWRLVRSESDETAA